ncbi:MAG: AsmA family protein [Alphaproteobacteria bacterium]|nr:AsmA family protein [Alphaproteobacteria bacterium]
MTTGKITKLLYWIAGSLIALLVAASVAISFVDWNQYRGLLAGMASSQLGMRVELGGRVGVSLVPRPAVSAETVRLFPEGGSVSDVVATADRIEMRLGLGALLQGKLAIQHLGFDGLDLALQEQNDGSWAVRGWPEQGDAGSDAAIQMERLNIVGGTVHFIDKGGKARSVEGLSFDLEGSLPTGPLEWDGSFVVAGQQVTSSGRMRPSLREGVLALKTDIALHGGELQVSGSLMDGGFSGRVQANGTSLRQFGSSLKSVMDGTAYQLPVPDQPFSLDLQVDRNAGIYSLVSRTLSVGETRGRLDLSVAEREKNFHVAGTASLGIVDFSHWFGDQPEVDENSNAQTTAKTAILTGALDIAVEGVRVNNGLVQQLDAVVSFKNDGAHITNLQALLPGGSGFFFVGNLGASGQGQGAVKIASGNLPELLRWVGYDPKGRIPAGRLATAEVETKLLMEGGYWQLSDLVSRVDTTNITGTLEGKMGAAWPSRVDLIADTINFDAYLPQKAKRKPVSDARVAELEQPEEGATFRIAVGDILLGGAKYKETNLKASVSDGAFKFEELSTRQGNGGASFSGTYRPFDEVAEINGAAKLTNWSWSVIRYLMPDIRPHIRSLGFLQVNGEITLAGRFDNLHMSAALEGPGNKKLTTSGNLSVKNGALAGIDLQGGFEHDNLRRFLAGNELQVLRPVPVKLTYALTKGEASSETFRVSGDLAGGQLTAEGQRTDDGREVAVTYDHRRARDVAGLLGMPADSFAQNQAIRGTGVVSLQGSGWAIRSMDVRSGSAHIRGNLTHSGTTGLDGNLTLEGLSYSRALNEPESSDFSGSPQISPTLFQYAGQVGLSVQGAQLFGQTISAPNATLVMGDGIIRFDLGENAIVNGAVSKIKLDLQSDNQILARGELGLPSIDIGRFMAGAGLATAVVGQAALDFSFEGSGATVDQILASLRGRGTMKGNAGTLNFLSVPSLVRNMSQAQTASAFLGGVGNWLRNGSTSYSQLEASFTLDAGTALVEKIAASGDWGQLSLDGQVNFLDRFLSLKGGLDLVSPPDTPHIPVVYEGPLNRPGSSWASTAFERFVIAGIERRLRATLQRDLQQIQGDNAGQSAGGAVFGRALGLLDLLRQKQEAEKKAAEEAANAQTAGSQGSEEQKP